MNYYVEYQQGKMNQSDYLSRHGKPFSTLPENEKWKQMNYTIYYTLHPLHQLQTNQEYNQLQSALQKTRSYPTSRNSQVWENMDTKNSIERPKNVWPILDESIITGNSILLKSYGIILPAKIQKEAIRLVHKSSYANINSTGRRLRSYSFFNDMRSKVKVFMNICTNWKTFVDKKTMEPLNFSQVTSRTEKQQRWILVINKR